MNENKLNYTVSGYISYEIALRLIDRLESNGIVASIIPGGIGVYPTENQVKPALRICADFNVTLTSEKTLEEIRVLEPDRFKEIIGKHLK